jgi:Fe-S-cluster-containing dehydrogenase component
MKSCPAKAIVKSYGNIKPVIQRDKCIGCFCCHELCLHKALEIKESFIAGFFIKNEKK